MKKISENLILGFMCFCLTIGIMVQVKTVESNKMITAKTIEEAELRDNILKLQEKYEEKYKNLNSANDRLEKLIENISKEGEQKTNYPEELKKLNSLLGYTTLEGPGLVITVQDGDKTTVKGNISDYVVHDLDLIEIVGLLKNAGAEAISINDERIVSNTAITCAGNIVKINGKKIGSPFVINAIGLPERLYGTVTVTNNLLKRMELQGVKVNIEKKDKLKIEKYMGVHAFNYATTEE